jgi:hypothetical protein
MTYNNSRARNAEVEQEIRPSSDDRDREQDTVEDTRFLINPEHSRIEPSKRSCRVITLWLLYSTHCGETQFVVGRYLRKSRGKISCGIIVRKISLLELLNSDLSMGVLSLVDLEQLLTFSPGAHNFVSYWISSIAVERNLVRLRSGEVSCTLGFKHQGV